MSQSWNYFKPDMKVGIEATTNRRAFPNR